ncbi:MAG: glutamine-hydrolyzing carbamoyl-phosphate synthase small subunit [Nitrospirota bacterium]|nr:glutamine-hydrolyzing carbamoyl-phosphate synthase small subunit [Nitrospirota bacterium]
MEKALLALADGRVFTGRPFGMKGEASGEVVFNTSMCGYQEILTDPSYQGQMVTMTYPEIGNYGYNDEDMEAAAPFVRGFIVKEYIDYPSNWRAAGSLGSFMKRHGIVGIQGIDTRALTRHIRSMGAMPGIISSLDLNPDSLVRRAKALPVMTGQDLASQVTCKAPYAWTEGLWELGVGYTNEERIRPLNVVAFDFGVKYNILRNLVSSGCKVQVVPASTSADDVLAMNPDGIFLSNGPGDPEAVTCAIETVRRLLGKKPIFGICLGHQILGLAMGGKTYKLKFGHRGGNQPVKDLTTGKVEITSQNHGFAVDVDSLGGSVELTHINLNDQTVEGFRHRELPVFSVQYHPEASPGPHDSSYLFRRFTAMMRGDAWR